MKYGPDKWDERFASEEFVYGTKPNEFLKQNIGSLPMGKVLCVADGEGRNGVFLARNGFEVTSIDFSQEALDKADKFAIENSVNIETICSDLLKYDFGKEQYDGIISIFSHFNKNETNDLHKKYFNALKPGGVFLIEAFAKEQLPLDSGGPKNIDLLYDIEDIESSFPEGDFQLLKKDIVYLHEGELHDGKAVVVRAIVQKPME